ncbi:MAG: hypothetical protein NVS9B5_00070 [Terriglobales bacterium]
MATLEFVPEEDRVSPGYASFVCADYAGRDAWRRRVYARGVGTHVEPRGLFAAEVAERVNDLLVEAAGFEYFS